MRSARVMASFVGVAALAAGAMAPPAVADDGTFDPAGAKPPPRIRIDQLGYLPSEAKHARLMTAGRVAHARFAIVSARGHAVLHGRVPAKPVGGWNRNYHAV